MPVFALAYLHDALRRQRARRGAACRRAAPPHGERRPAGGRTAHVEELSRSVPALVLEFEHAVDGDRAAQPRRARGADDAPLRPLVRGCSTRRKDGRWGNTQENALAMESLVAYYRKYETEVPDFRAVVKLGDGEVARQEFRGRARRGGEGRADAARAARAGAGKRPGR